MQREVVVENLWRRSRKTRSLAQRRIRFYTYTALAIAVLTISLTSPTQASSTGSNLVQNGGFETLMNTTGANGTSLPAGMPTAFGPLCAAHGAQTAASDCPTTSPVVDWQGSGLVVVYTPFSSSPSGTSADSIGATWKNFLPCADNNPAPGATCATRDTTGGTGAFRLWGPGTNTANCQSPCNAALLAPSNNLGNCDKMGCGGNFLALDGDFHLSSNGIPFQGEIQQQMTGLTAGKTYDISFFWAGGQQVPRSASGGLQYQFLVGLCPAGISPGDSVGATSTSLFNPGPSGTGCGVYTKVISAPSNGFSGWTPDTIDIKATQADELLSFIAIGTPSTGSQPPIVLLDGVTMQEQPVPEPKASSLLAIALVGLSGLAYRRPKWLRLAD
jgi:hypothetical protein